METENKEMIYSIDNITNKLNLNSKRSLIFISYFNEIQIFETKTEKDNENDLYHHLQKFVNFQQLYKADNLTLNQQFSQKYPKLAILFYELKKANVRRNLFSNSIIMYTVNDNMRGNEEYFIISPLDLTSIDSSFSNETPLLVLDYGIYNIILSCSNISCQEYGKLISKSLFIENYFILKHTCEKCKAKLDFNNLFYSGSKEMKIDFYCLNAVNRPCHKCYEAILNFNEDLLENKDFDSLLLYSKDKECKQCESLGIYYFNTNIIRKPFRKEAYPKGRIIRIIIPNDVISFFAF